MDLALIAREDVFSYARARQAGIGPAELRGMLRARECVRLHHGWFSTRAPKDEIDRHLLRVAALLEQYAGRAVASHDSGLMRLGLPVYRADLSRVHLTAIDARVRRHRKADLIVHDPIGTPALGAAALGPTERQTVHPALAIAHCGLRDVRALLVPGDAALRGALITPGELETAVTSLRARPGVARARAGLALVDARHETPGETLTACVLRLLGYDIEPQFQVAHTGQFTPAGQGYRADFRLRGARVLIEFDGRVKYTSREALWQEKLREDHLRSLGYEVVRLTWADLRDPDRVRGLLEAAIRRARVYATHPQGDEMHPRGPHDGPA